MKKSEMLRKAKRFLWDGVSENTGKTVYICYALGYAVGDKQAQPLCNIIHERLEAYPTLFAWLRYKCNIPWEQLKDKAVQKHRYQWVDMLIEEFEAKGD